MSCEAVPHRCNNGHTWTAGMFYETGGWFYDKESQANCPVCGEDGMVIDATKPFMFTFTVKVTRCRSLKCGCVKLWVRKFNPKRQKLHGETIHMFYKNMECVKHAH